MNLFERFVEETGNKYIKIGVDKNIRNEEFDDLYIAWLEDKLLTVINEKSKIKGIDLSFIDSLIKESDTVIYPWKEG